MFSFVAKSTSRKQSSGESDREREGRYDSRIHIKYAKGFWLEEREGYVVLNIKDPQESSHTHYQYALVPRGSTVQTPKDLPVVALPVRSAICMTSLQLSNFIKLGAMDRVVGITSTRFLFNKDMQRRWTRGYPSYRH